MNRAQRAVTLQPVRATAGGSGALGYERHLFPHRTAHLPTPPRWLPPQPHTPLPLAYTRSACLDYLHPVALDATAPHCRGFAGCGSPHPHRLPRLPTTLPLPYRNTPRRCLVTAFPRPPRGVDHLAFSVLSGHTCGSRHYGFGCRFIRLFHLPSITNLVAYLYLSVLNAKTSSRIPFVDGPLPTAYPHAFTT